MKQSKIACVCIAASALFALAAGGPATAADKPVIGMTSGGGSKGAPDATVKRRSCPPGQTVSTNPLTGAQTCVPVKPPHNPLVP